MQHQRDNSKDDLIIGYLKKELTPDQITELVSWLKMDKSNKRYFDEFCEIWITALARSENAGYNDHLGFLKFRERIEKENTPLINLQSKHYYKVILRYAAIVFLAFSAGGVLFYQMGKKQAASSNLSYNELIVPRGARAQFLLFDGTKVTLNAGSKLKYNNHYGEIDRVVELEGEGYFEVAKDSKRPFIVNTSHIGVKALGTKFNVKAYPGDKTIETTLVEGSVKVEQRDDKKEVKSMILKPNQKLTYYKKEQAEVTKSFVAAGKAKEKEQESEYKENADHELMAENVDIKPIVSWKENRWIIEMQTLDQLALILERKFDVTIQFKSERLKTFRFTGTLRDEPIEQVLKVMSITAPISYELKGKYVTIFEKSNFEDVYNKLYNKR